MKPRTTKNNCKSRQKVELYSSDKVMLGVQRALIYDLMSDTKVLQGRLMTACSAGIPALRVALQQGGLKEYDGCYGSYMALSPCNFKRVRQCENFLKRYIFNDDLYSESELKDKLLAGFVRSQGTYGVRSTASDVLVVCQRAKTIASRILGNFSEEALFSLCKWGKRAAFSLPRRDSYLDNRVVSVNGTRLQLALFRRYLRGDSRLSDLVRGNKKTSVVEFTSVPKSYKAQRGIAPDTTAGGFLSAGLGRLIRQRLEGNTHINLQRAQEIHQNKARQGSINGFLATGDLSAASDSFVWEHMELLMPSDWLAILRTVRTPRVEIEGYGRVDLSTYMLMGSGHTFPLQTLLFYSILKAVCELQGSHSRKIWVFGDDLIYPSIHAEAVQHYLTALGFTLNPEKSFSKGPFRESCGGDYHTGVDVRPTMPEGSGRLIPKNSYISFLFTITNGLLRRWDHFEIPSALGVLYAELRRVLDVIPAGVDGLHGDDSCITQNVPEWFEVVEPEVWPIEGFLRTSFDAAAGRPKTAFVPDICGYTGIREIRQRVLVPRTEKRKKKSMEPYLWEAIRQSSDCGPPSLYDSSESDLSTLSETKRGNDVRYKWVTKTTVDPRG